MSQAWVPEIQRRNVYLQGMVMTRRRQFIVLGALISAAAGAVSVLYMFQPWRSCSYDELSSACAMLPQDAIVLMAGLTLTLIGGAILSMALLANGAPSSMSASRRSVVFGVVPLSFATVAAGVFYLF
jgi:hypothetical protein